MSTFQVQNQFLFIDYTHSRVVCHFKNVDFKKGFIFILFYFYSV